MVLRGRRMASSNSTQLNSNVRWSRARPSSAADGDPVADETSVEKTGKSNNISTKSSPGGPNSKVRQASPLVKRITVSASKSVKGNQWRSRLASRNLNSTSASKDPRFLITSEDFPALPGVKDAKNDSPKKILENEKEEKKVAAKDKTDDMPDSIEQESNRPESADSIIETLSGFSTTDDSGLSSISRWNTASRDESDEFEKTNEKQKKKQKSPPKSSTSPTKELNGNASRGNLSYRKSPSATKNASDGVNSQKRKVSHQNHSSSSPSFIKLTKSGQKIPERRGGMKNNVFSPKKFEENKQLAEEVNLKDSEKNEEKNKKEDNGKLVFGVNGEITEIPKNMIQDQFGLAAIFPIYLSFGQNLENNSTVEESIFKKNIQTLTFGIDLNSLGVPTKVMEQRHVWKSFSGPYGHHVMSPTDMSVELLELPIVYNTAKALQGSIDMGNRVPEKYGDQELLYIFYNFPGEMWQMNAARELQFRGWRFEMKEKLWVNRKNSQCNSAEELVKCSTRNGDEEYCVGVFQFYDPEKARITYREFRTLWSNFEEPAWVQKDCDEATKNFISAMTSDQLWGPPKHEEGWWRNMGHLGGTNGGFGAGLSSNGRFNRNQQHQQLNETEPKRLLSFVDPVDYSLASRADSAKVEEAYRQHMYSMFLQQAQKQQALNSAKQSYT